MTVARNQFALAILDIGKRTESIVFKFKEPVRMIKRLFARLQRLGNESLAADQTKEGRSFHNFETETRSLGEEPLRYLIAFRVLRI